MTLTEWTVYLADTPSPTPLKPEDMNAATVTPGLPGFFVFLFIAVASLLLLWDMSRRVRTASARENVRLRMKQRIAELDAEEAAQREAHGGSVKSTDEERPGAQGDAEEPRERP